MAESLTQGLNLMDTKKKFLSFLPYGSEKNLGNINDFFSSNTLIAKATFLMFVILIFSLLYYIGSRIIFNILSPSETPYIIYGMKDATETEIVNQNIANKKSIPLFRSKNQYEGIEFTYSFWIYVKDINYSNDTDFKHVFHKGTLDNGEGGSGIYGPNNCPGVYLYNGKKNYSEDLLEKYPLLGLLVRLNIFYDKNNRHEPFKYYEDIYVDGIPIKKWVGIIIRTTSQNIVDIYINGTLTKRHKLSNIIKQNYDNLNINLNGGFYGNISNLKYYNYAIGTFEIDNITSSGPNLQARDDSNIKKSKPYYLANQWYFNEVDPLVQQ